MIASKTTVAATPTLVAEGGASVSPLHVTLRVPSGGSTVYLGNEAVTSTDGFPLAADESITVILQSEPLYARTASGTQDINVIVS